MSTALMKKESSALALSEEELLTVLESSLYPGAAKESIKLVVGYCKAAGLDPMQKPVHIVPIWDAKAGRMRDVIMPGIGLYRTQASRTGEFAGMSEPEFGPDITESIGGQSVTYPEWCRVKVKRLLPSGAMAEFTALEFWIENYAIKGGKEKSVAPNAMWTKRKRGQLAKCTSAQALRIAFPELGAAPTAEEMEGKEIDMGAAEVVSQETVQAPRSKSASASAPLEGAVEREEPAPTAGEHKPMTDGMKKMIGVKLEASALTETDLVAKFGAGLDELDAGRVNEVLEWAKNPNV